MSYVVLVVGALGIASAIYIIADLISPFSGVFVVSPMPLVDVLKVVEEAAAPAYYVAVRHDDFPAAKLRP